MIIDSICSPVSKFDMANWLELDNILSCDRWTSLRFPG
jgi:hypothetical protein